LETIARIDLDRLNPQFGNALFPVYLDLIRESPDRGGLATVLPTSPAPTSRPHILYAIQWWLFSAVASVGWLLYLRKQFFTE
jgi:cytochrome oxidase assembly protein ShyY1